MKDGAAADALFPRILIESRTYAYREFEEDYISVTINKRINIIK
jgi:hypothetical protein